jgi:predicted transcriptional regulator
MNKVIILSVQPQWIHKILTGKKTIEIRKSMPKCDYPIDVYLYCTKGKPYLYESFEELWWWNDGVLEPFGDRYGVRLSDFELPEKFHDSESRGWNNLLNGFIVAKFTLNKVGKFKVEFLPLLQEMGYVNPYTLTVYDGIFKTMFLEQNSCLLLEDIYKYNKNNNSYAWHIDDLQIFDKPMELSEFYRNNFQVIQDYEPCNNYDCIYTVDNSILGDDGYCHVDECPRLRISRPPMSWEYAYKDE